MLRALLRLLIVLTVIWFFIVIAFLVLVGTGGFEPVTWFYVLTYALSPPFVVWSLVWIFSAFKSDSG